MKELSEQAPSSQERRVERVKRGELSEHAPCASSLLDSLRILFA
jgi:hypothetical protein